MERMVCELPPLSIHQSPACLSWGLCRMGIQSGLCNGINGNTQAGGAQLCSLAQNWCFSRGGVICVRVCVFSASRAWKQALCTCTSACVHVCMLHWFNGCVCVCTCVHTPAGWKHSSWLELETQSAKWQTRTRAHISFSSVGEDRGSSGARH